MGKAEFDDYPTPMKLALWCVRALRIPSGARVLEPHAGRARFVRALLRVHPDVRVFANELQPKYIPRLNSLLGPKFVRCGDFLDIRKRPRFDFIVGNTPFSGNAGIEHAEHAFGMLAPGGSLGLLLPARYIHSRARFEFWEKHRPREVYAFAERPSFRYGRSDKYDYAFFVWTLGWKGHTRMHIVSWKS